MFSIRKEKEVVMSDEEKKIAEELREAITKMENESDEDKASLKEETCDMRPQEEMSCDIAIHLAYMTESRFEDMIEGMEIDTIKQLVRRIENTEAEAAVKMLQTMFLARGMVDAAIDLDILKICADYDEDAYEFFVDVLYDSDVFDWFSVECLFDDYKDKEPAWKEVS